MKKSKRWGKDKRSASRGGIRIEDNHLVIRLPSKWIEAYLSDPKDDRMSEFMLYTAALAGMLGCESWSFEGVSGGGGTVGSADPEDPFFDNEDVVFFSGEVR